MIKKNNYKKWKHEIPTDRAAFDVMKEKSNVNCCIESYARQQLD